MVWNTFTNLLKLTDNYQLVGNPAYNFGLRKPAIRLFSLPLKKWHVKALVDKPTIDNEGQKAGR